MARDHISAVQQGAASLFQSMTEEVARQMDEHTQQTSDARGTTRGRRPNLNHPLVRAASHIARQWEEGKDPAVQAEESKEKGVTAADIGDTAAVCASLAAQLFWARLKKSPNADDLEDQLKFSTCDPSWLQAVKQYLAYFGPDGKAKPIPYVRYQSLDDFVIPGVAPNARIALIADWGTGTDDARDLLKQVASHQPDVLIHLGDIYYAGTPDECQEYFLDIINQVFDRAHKPIPVYTLTGNHDMYCGGVGYYGLLPKLNPSPRFGADEVQLASYFSLRTSDGAWQLLAMDTSLHDHDPFSVSKTVTFLDPAEEAWHVDKIQRWSAAGGRTILLSHHQLFSPFSGIGEYEKRPSNQRALNPKLAASYEKFRAAGEIAAWFWGHEHNLGIYEAYAGLDRGRCIGHGAIPVFTVDDPYKALAELDPAQTPQLVRAGQPLAPVELGHDGDVYAHGFVILDLDPADRSATATYYQETSSKPIWQEKL